MSSSTPTLERFSFRDGVARFWARPAAAAPVWASVVLAVAMAGSLVCWRVGGTNAGKPWLVAGIVLLAALLFSVSVAIVAVRGRYTVTLDFGSGRLSVEDVRGLDAASRWSGGFQELQSLRVRVEGEVTVISFVWADGGTPPLQAMIRQGGESEEGLRVFLLHAEVAGLRVDRAGA